jgi:RecA/RadA recombinase
MYGGKAIPFYSSIIIKLRRSGKIKVNNIVVGNNVGLTV